MALSGTFDTMQLADLLQWIQSSQKSGVLTLSIDIEDTYLYFNRGKLTALGSEDPLRLDLGQVLLAQRLIAEEELRRALMKTRDGLPMTKAILEVTRLTEDAISKILSDHTFELTMDLFFYEEGSFHFSTGAGAAGLLAPLDVPNIHYLKDPIDTKTIIFEGMRRLDEWNRIREIFPNGYVVVHALSGMSENPVWVELRKLGAPISVGELCLRLGGGRFSVFKDLYDAYQQNMIGLDLALKGKTAQANQSPVDMLLENARILLEEKQFDEARALLTTAANLDPDHHTARDLLKQLREAQLESLYQQIPPHQIPVLTQSLDQLKAYDLSPRETFLASRLTGKWDVATLVVMTPMGELETLRTIQKFLHAGIAKFAY